jgi:hypothetical protein
MDVHSSPLDPVTQPQQVRWIGGVLRPRGCTYRGKPLRVAAWITSCGSLVGAAIVDGHGPTVLRELLTDLLTQAPEDRRPTQLVVWPSVRAAFRRFEYPPVSVEQDQFLSVVIGDEVDCGYIPGRLSVRSG